MKVVKLIDQYRMLTDGLVLQAGAVGAGVKVSRFSPKVTGQGPAERVAISGMLYLKDWPYSATSKKPTKNIDILVKSQELYQANSLQLVQSVVQVMYFSAHSEQADPSLGLHYDYEHSAGAAHPIFHAQFGNSNFSAEELAAVDFNRLVLPWKDLVRVRIPTVHIGFPGAILGLFADHLPHEAFAGFLTWAKEQRLFMDVKARIDCRDMPLGEMDAMVFQAHRLYV